MSQLQQGLTFVVEDCVRVVGGRVGGGCAVVEIAKETLPGAVNGEEGAGRGGRIVRVAEGGALLIVVSGRPRQFLVVIIVLTINILSDDMIDEIE